MLLPCDFIENYESLHRSTSFNYYSLYKSVELLGGLLVVEENDLWDTVCDKLNLNATMSSISCPSLLLKQAYREIILPFENHISFLKSLGITNDQCIISKSHLSSLKTDLSNCSSISKFCSKDYSLKCVSHGNGENSLKQHTNNGDSGSSESVYHKTQEEHSFNGDLSKSPNSNTKLPIFSSEPVSSNDIHYRKKIHTLDPRHIFSETLRNKSGLNDHNNNDDDNDNEYVLLCEACDTISFEKKDTILCYECKGAFHKKCITDENVFLFFQTTRTDFWYCPKCLIGSCEFGFQAGDDYTLNEFQQFANSFQETFLKKNTKLQSLSKNELENSVESIFWDYVNSINETLTVEYGSDIRCNTSGFPLSVEMQHNKYAKDSWNLNNLPLNQDSLFHNLNTDISGMNIPWIYVGMMFSTFCWHCEDHYTYSVNYQHFGDTKTWYGIPGSHAEKFEQALHDIVPELFEKQPDLLFQLVTMVSPDSLVERGVNLYAIDQGPGEFVITMPKAYHSGFNHGYNFNEAVNFAPPDWLPFGAESMMTYQLQCRTPVFSFDRLMIQTAKLDTRKQTARWFYSYFEEFIKREIKLRHTLFDCHPETPIRLLYGELSEEDYQCCICYSLPYLSRIIITSNEITTKTSRYSKSVSKDYISCQKHKNHSELKNPLEAKDQTRRPVGRPRKQAEIGKLGSSNNYREGNVSTKLKEKTEYVESLFSQSNQRKRGRPLKPQEGSPHKKLPSETGLKRGKNNSSIDDRFGIKRILFGEDYIENNTAPCSSKHSLTEEYVTVCHMHIPKVIPKTLRMEFHIKWTNSELTTILNNLKNRI